MPQIKFSVNGEVQLSRNLRLFAQKIKDKKAFHKDAIDIVSDRSDDIFKAKGTNVQKSPKWAPLSASTKKARANRHGYYKKSPNSPSILRWTGNLQNSRTKKATNDFGQLSFDAAYATYHQSGGGKLPKRAIIDLDNNTNTKIIKALQKRLHDAASIFGRQV